MPETESSGAATAAAAAAAVTHILVYPFPGRGHIIPFLDLTRGLLSRGLTVTALVTTSCRDLLEPLACPSLEPLVYPDPPAGTSSLVQTMREVRDLHHPLLLEWFKSQPTPPTAIFSDFFLGWTQKLAAEVGVPRIVFSPTSCFSFSVSCSMGREPPAIENPDDENSPVSFPKIPNSPEYPCYQINEVYRKGKEGDPDREFYRENWLGNLESWGLVFNTFTELEGAYVDHMKKEMGHDRVWAVGPLMVPKEPKEKEGEGGDDNSAAVAADDGDLMSRGGASAVSCQELMGWLDTRQDHSVVYVCFGSHQELTRQQIDVLAAGLQESGVHFIWAVREPKEGGQAEAEKEEEEESSDNDDDTLLLPEGFEERVAGKGFIIRGWAPQMVILRHRALGGILTHCGWNSSLEAIVAGTLMLAWPLGADQFTNTKLLVDQHKIGIRLGESTRNIPDPAKLAQLLVESLDEARPERVEAKRFKEAAMAAVKGGSSEKDMDAFIKAVNEINHEESKAPAKSGKKAGSIFGFRMRMRRWFKSS